MSAFCLSAIKSVFPIGLRLRNTIHPWRIRSAAIKISNRAPRSLWASLLNVMVSLENIDRSHLVGWIIADSSGIERRGATLTTGSKLSYTSLWRCRPDNTYPSVSAHVSWPFQMRLYPSADVPLESQRPRLRACLRSLGLFHGRLHQPKACSIRLGLAFGRARPCLDGQPNHLMDGMHCPSRHGPVRVRRSGDLRYLYLL